MKDIRLLNRRYTALESFTGVVVWAYLGIAPEVHVWGVTEEVGDARRVHVGIPAGDK